MSTLSLRLPEGDKFLGRQAGRFSSEDLHHALFGAPTEPHTLEEMKVGIRAHIKSRHPRSSIERVLAKEPNSEPLTEDRLPQRE